VDARGVQHLKGNNHDEDKQQRGWWTKSEGVPVLCSRCCQQRNRDWACSSVPCLRSAHRFHRHMTLCEWVKDRWLLLFHYSWKPYFSNNASTFKLVLGKQKLRTFPFLRDQSNSFLIMCRGGQLQFIQTNLQESKCCVYIWLWVQCCRTRALGLARSILPLSLTVLSSSVLS